MAKCPNCDLSTTRTKDWACQWCGYPLVSGSFRQSSKTYQEVRAERIREWAPSETVKTDVPTENAESTTPEEEAESSVTVPSSQVVESGADIPMRVEPTPEIVLAEKPEPEPVTEADEMLQTKAEATPQAVLEQEKESEPISGVTVAELCSSYQSYGMAGHNEFENRAFLVSGTLDSIVIKDIVGQYYITLSDNAPHPLGNIHCRFKKEDVSELNRLTIGQALKVQGVYEGFVTNIVLTDCLIVSCE